MSLDTDTGFAQLPATHSAVNCVMIAADRTAEGVTAVFGAVSVITSKMLLNFQPMTKQILSWRRTRRSEGEGVPAGELCGTLRGSSALAPLLRFLAAFRRQRLLNIR